MTRFSLPAALAVALSGAACAAPYARLDGVLANTKPLAPTEAGKVTVTHGGSTRNGTVGMSIHKGDRILTSADGVAVLTLRSGYEVIMEPGTEAVIESIFSRLGKFIVKKVSQIRAALELKTEFVGASVDGTIFTFEVTRDTVVRIAVLEGRVTVRPRRATWAAVTYQAGDLGVIRREGPPDRVRPLDQVTSRAVDQRIREVEQAIHYNPTPLRSKAFWQKPAFFVPVAAVAAVTTVILVTKNGNKDGLVTIHFPF